MTLSVSVFAPAGQDDAFAALIEEHVAEPVGGARRAGKKSMVIDAIVFC
jgi:hypothetical protein